MKNPPVEDLKLNPLVVTDVDIFPIRPQRGLVAFASCILNGQLYLGNIAIYTRLDGNGYRLVFPMKVLPNGKQIQCFYPLTWESGVLLQQAIVGRFEKLVEMLKENENVKTMSNESGGFNGSNSGTV